MLRIIRDTDAAVSGPNSVDLVAETIAFPGIKYAIRQFPMKGSGVARLIECWASMQTGAYPSIDVYMIGTSFEHLN